MKTFDLSKFKALVHSSGANTTCIYGNTDEPFFTVFQYRKDKKCMTIFTMKTLDNGDVLWNHKTYIREAPALKALNNTMLNYKKYINTLRIKRMNDDFK